MTEIDLTPITRLEYDIDAILNDHAVAEPITRIELILADIVAGNTTTIVPVTRIETYLAIISGADYPVPEPVTRIETFLAIIAGEDYETPEAVTRLEGLLAEWVEKGSGIWKTVTGTLLHLTDALASPVRELNVAIEPQQSGSGDPSPTNVRPITGWTGCNIFHTGINIFDGEMENGDIDSQGQNSGTSASRYRSKNYVPIRAASEDNEYVSFYFHSPGRTGTVRAFFYDGNKSFLWGYTLNVNTAITNFHIGSIVRYMRFRYGTGKVDGDSQISINIPSTVTEYVPYVSNTYPISWQTEAGTVYGGTLDVVSGVLTVNRAEIDMGSMSWRYTGVSSSYPYGFLYANITGKLKGISNFICSIYPVVYQGFSVDKHMEGNNSNLTVYCIDSSYTDAASFKTAMTGQKIVYELATPITYQLTPQEISTLAGENNVWGDGTIELTYKAQAE